MFGMLDISELGARQLEVLVEVGVGVGVGV